MENQPRMKVKRKDLDYVNDDFSYLSLSSPARKIRRLELPPIIEDTGTEIPLELGHEISIGVEDKLNPPVIEELPPMAENEESAIVMFKPMNNSFLPSPSNFSVDPQLISLLKNNGLWSTKSNPIVQHADESDDNMREDAAGANECLAVVPWIPSQQLPQSQGADAPQAMASELMDADETEAATMDIEYPIPSPALGHERPVDYYNVIPGNEGMQHRWQQQHCSMPQLPGNTTTPICLYR